MIGLHAAAATTMLVVGQTTTATPLDRYLTVGGALGIAVVAAMVVLRIQRTSVADLRADRAADRHEIEELRADRDADRVTMDALREALTAARAEVSACHHERVALRSRIAALETEVDGLYRQLGLS